MANEQAAPAQPAKRRPVLNTADFDAVLFDLDGVITHTRKVHAAAWNDVFNNFLRDYAAAHGKEVAPFDVVQDYVTFLDGRPRHEGVHDFLASRGIELPIGRPDDPDSADSAASARPASRKASPAWPNMIARLRSVAATAPSAVARSRSAPSIG